METTTKFDCWALVELMGHQRIVGRVTEQNVAGAALLRVDVPDQAGGVAYTRLYGPAAIYCISPIEEGVARAMARQIGAEPVKQYEIPRQLSHGVEHCPQCWMVEDECACPDVDDDDDDDDDDETSAPGTPEDKGIL